MGGSGSAPAGDQTPSAVQMRMRILEMSSVFSELNDGVLRAVARRMRVVGLAARDTLRLGGQGGDVVVFLASGQVEESVTDASGKVLLTRRPAPGDLVILPAPRTGGRYTTSIYGLTGAVLLTLDRDGLLEGLGADVEKIAVVLDKLWEQELSAGASAMNIVTAATALGYGACWLTGWFAFDRDVLDGLGLKADEKLAGFIHIGTVRKPNEDRPRPMLSDVVTRF